MYSQFEMLEGVSKGVKYAVIGKASKTKVGVRPVIAVKTEKDGFKTVMFGFKVRIESARQPAFPCRAGSGEDHYSSMFMTAILSGQEIPANEIKAALVKAIPVVIHCFYSEMEDAGIKMTASEAMFAFYVETLTVENMDAVAPPQHVVLNPQWGFGA